jgi:glycosyltransferase involved in cell wall biosynthesis
MPKVSVIIPTHNRSELLRVAIQSVLNQTFEDFEIVVVDDASKDDTEDVAKGIGDNRIVYIRHETNRGEGGTRNTGVKNSKGEYIAWLDDDDEWLPEKLQRQVAILDYSPKEVGGVYTGWIIIDGNTGRILSSLLPSKRGNIFLELLYEFHILVSSLMLRKSCFEKVGWFDESIPFGLDHDMWVRIAKEFQFECIEEVLAKYRIHDKRLTTNLDLSIAGHEKFFEKYKQWLEMRPKVYSKKYLNLGIVYCLNGNLKKGRAAYRRSIAIYPYRIKPYLTFFLAYTGANVFRKVTNMWNKASSAPFP